MNGCLCALPYLKLADGTLVNGGSGVLHPAVSLQGMHSASEHGEGLH